MRAHADIPFHFNISRCSELPPFVLTRFNKIAIQGTAQMAVD